MAEQDQGRVSIVGASAAGLFAAYLLARAGFDVHLMEAGEEIGAPERTLIVTEQMNRTLGFVPAEAIVNRIKRFELFSGRHKALITLARPDLVVKRRALLKLLMRKAVREGAKVESGCRFKALEAHGSDPCLLVERSNGGEKRLHARTLIGADGVYSQVAQASGMGRPERVAVLQAEVLLPPDTSADTVKVWFDVQKTPYFYWLIPESRERGVVGLIAEGLPEARRALDSFLNARPFQVLGLQAAEVAQYNPRFKPWKKLDNCRIYLVGDAAGQVKASTVGGVVAGLRGARALATALIRNRGYGKELRRLQWELNMHRWVRMALNRFDQLAYDELLRLLNPRARAVLSSYTRDELSRACLALLFAQPRYPLLAVRAFLGGGYL